MLAIFVMGFQESKKLDGEMKLADATMELVLGPFEGRGDCEKLARFSTN
jgi:hypothetical protein